MSEIDWARYTGVTRRSVVKRTGAELVAIAEAQALAAMLGLPPPTLRSAEVAPQPEAEPVVEEKATAVEAAKEPEASSGAAEAKLPRLEGYRGKVRNLDPTSSRFGTEAKVYAWEATCATSSHRSKVTQFTIIYDDDASLTTHPERHWGSHVFPIDGSLRPHNGLKIWLKLSSFSAPRETKIVGAAPDCGWECEHGYAFYDRHWLVDAWPRSMRKEST